jgi:hypothetical protein
MFDLTLSFDNGPEPKVTPGVLDILARRDIQATIMVLHDLPTDAIRHLARFLDRAEAAGPRFRQDFPPDCVPIQRGKRCRSTTMFQT